jgi:hypothetical protein
MPVGNTGQRGAAVTGALRFNTDTTNLEFYNGATWNPPGFPAGTVMLFAQPAAPLGWTKVTSAAYNNSAIRVITGAGGGTTAGIAFSTVFSSAYTYSGVINITSGQVGNTVLSIAQLASHNHTTGRVFTQMPGPATPIGGNNYDLTFDTGFTGGNAAHTHSLVGAIANGNFTANLGVQYIDVIACSKD